MAPDALMLVDVLMSEAIDTTKSAIAHKDASLEAITTTCYTLGFEAGLALGLQDPEAGQLMLRAIDHVMNQHDPRTLVERQQYLARYLAALRS